MFARKLGRLACLVFVLAAVVGGSVGAANLTTKPTGAVTSFHSASPLAQLDIVWE
jgi:hypothetical protein